VVSPSGGGGGAAMRWKATKRPRQSVVDGSRFSVEAENFPGISPCRGKYSHDLGGKKKSGAAAVQQMATARPP